VESHGANSKLVNLESEAKQSLNPCLQFLSLKIPIHDKFVRFLTYPCQFFFTYELKTYRNFNLELLKPFMCISFILSNLKK
jgi:hypothetical protein